MQQWTENTCDNDSTSLSNTSCENVEDICLAAISDDHGSNHNEFYESHSKSPVRFHYPTTFWIVQSSQSWNLTDQKHLGMKTQLEIEIVI